MVAQMLKTLPGAGINKFYFYLFSLQKYKNSIAMSLVRFHTNIGFLNLKSKYTILK